MLREFFAVAPVPQPEDFGFDEVASILRKQGQFLIPEESCFVQIKAKSERTIRYSRAQYEWLLGLSFPLFIASVDLDKREISPFTTHRAACRTDTDQYDLVEMHLDWVEWSNEGRKLRQYLGEPIAELKSDGDMTKAEIQQLYHVIKLWIMIESAHRNLICIKFYEGFTVYAFPSQLVPISPESNARDGLE